MVEFRSQFLKRAIGSLQVGVTCWGRALKPPRSFCPPFPNGLVVFVCVLSTELAALADAFYCFLVEGRCLVDCRCYSLSKLWQDLLQPRGALKEFHLASCMAVVGGH